MKALLLSALLLASLNATAGDLKIMGHIEPASGGVLILDNGSCPLEFVNKETHRGGSLYVTRGIRQPICWKVSSDSKLGPAIKVVYPSEDGGLRFPTWSYSLNMVTWAE